MSHVRCKQTICSVNNMPRIRVQTRRYVFKTNQKYIHCIARIVQGLCYILLCSIRFLTSARIFVWECVSYFLQLHLYGICTMFVSIFLVVFFSARFFSALRFMFRFDFYENPISAKVNACSLML